MHWEIRLDHENYHLPNCKAEDIPHLLRLFDGAQKISRYSKEVLRESVEIGFVLTEGPLVPPQTTDESHKREE